MTDVHDEEPGEQEPDTTHAPRALARRALARWGIPTDAHLDLVKHRENAVFRVTAGDDSYALRVHRAGYHDDGELWSELQWIAALDADGFRTPQIVPTTDGESFATVSSPEVPEPRQVDVLEWFDGAPIGEAGSGIDADTDRAGLYRTIGALMAHTHEHGVRWDRPAGFTRHAWDEDGLLGDAPVWGPYWELDELDDDQRARLRSFRPVALAELDAFGKAPDRYGLIHADFLPENLLRGPGGVCLIDFDDAGFGWHLFDVATTVFFDVGEEHFDETLGALVEGYRSRRPLPDAHLAHLPLFLALRGVTYLGWAHTRRETETAQVMAPFIAPGVDDLVRAYLEGS